jgi:DNA-binding NarL/FixJ family response regulator
MAGPVTGATVLVIEPSGIYRLGMEACLTALAGIGRVSGYESPAAAWSDGDLLQADLVIISVEVDEIATLVTQVRRQVGCPVLATALHWQEDAVMAAIDAGAVGVISKEGLSTAALSSQVHATLNGAGVVPAELLSRLLLRDDRHARSSSGLNTREQRVLRLFADGKLTREVACDMAYSERTVKTVLRDAVMKLGATSRSQAIAYAVRDGLI